MIMTNTRLDLTGTYEEAMKEINEAPISDEFKEHLREEYHKVYDEAYIVEQKKGANKKAPEKAKITNRLSINRFKNQTKGQK